MECATTVINYSEQIIQPHEPLPPLSFIDAANHPSVRMVNGHPDDGLGNKCENITVLEVKRGIRRYPNTSFCLDCGIYAKISILNSNSAQEPFTGWVPIIPSADHHKNEKQFYHIAQCALANLAENH